MRKLLGGAVVALALVAGVVTLTGFRGGCGGHGHGHGRDPAKLAAFVNDRVDDALDDLDATPEQRERIHALAGRLLEAGKAAHEGHEGVRATLLGQWKAETPDRAALHALVDERVDALRALAHQAVDAGVEAHGVLTPAQREKVARKAERMHR